MDTNDFEEAKKYLQEIDKWKEVYNFRLDGYEIVGMAEMYKKKAIKENEENGDI